VIANAYTTTGFANTHRPVTMESILHALNGIEKQEEKVLVVWSFEGFKKLISGMVFTPDKAAPYRSVQIVEDSTKPLGYFKLETKKSVERES